MSFPKTLHALQDDFSLNANGDTFQLPSTFLFPYYLTDPSGNRLTDPSGNYLIGYFQDNVSFQVLHALPDDFSLNTE